MRTAEDSGGLRRAAEGCGGLRMVLVMRTEDGADDDWMVIVMRTGENCLRLGGMAMMVGG